VLGGINLYSLMCVGGYQFVFSHVCWGVSICILSCVLGGINLYSLMCVGGYQFVFSHVCWGVSICILSCVLGGINLYSLMCVGGYQVVFSHVWLGQHWYPPTHMREYKLIPPNTHERIQIDTPQHTW
jgi:hypothetical protein